MVFEGDSLKDYRLDFKDDKLVKVELPNVEDCKVGKLEKIEQIVEQYQLYKFDGFLKIKEVLEEE